MVTRCQLNKLVYERNKGVSITMSAMKAGVARNTARKYLRQADPTYAQQQPHTWRTRPDPLEAIWNRAQAMLEPAPELEAKALLEHLCGERAPRCIGEGDASGVFAACPSGSKRRFWWWKCPSAIVRLATRPSRSPPLCPSLRPIQPFPGSTRLPIEPLDALD